jgi:hypothetical protein
MSALLNRRAPTLRLQEPFGTTDELPRRCRHLATRRTVAVVLVALVVTACESGPESYASARQVVRAMADADVQCASFESGNGIPAPVGGRRSLVEGRGVCSIDGQPVVIATFDNAEDRADWVAVGKLLGPVAVGPNWVATSRSGKVVAEIAEALEATHERGN